VITLLSKELGVLLLKVLSASEFPQEKDDDAPADFYPPAASGISPICKGSDIRTIEINLRKGV
jgi:hypothetical protein